MTVHLLHLHQREVLEFRLRLELQSQHFQVVVVHVTLVPVRGLGGERARVHGTLWLLLLLLLLSGSGQNRCANEGCGDELGEHAFVLVVTEQRDWQA